MGREFQGVGNGPGFGKGMVPFPVDPLLIVYRSTGGQSRAHARPFLPILLL